MIGIGALVLAVNTAPTRGWLDPAVAAMFVVAAGAVLKFVVVELRAPRPMLDVRLFARHGFRIGTASLTIQFIVAFGVLLLLTQYLELLLGYTPLRAGLALAPMGGPPIVLSLLAPRLTRLFGLRTLTTVGLLTITVGLFSVSLLTRASGYLKVLSALLVFGTGLGLCTAPATAALVADIPREKHGVAAGVNDAAREIGAAVGIAIAGSVLAAGYYDTIRPALSSLPAAARSPVSTSLAATLEVTKHRGTLTDPIITYAKNAFLQGTHQASLALASISLVGAAIVAISTPRTTRAKPPSESPAPT